MSEKKKYYIFIGIVIIVGLLIYSQMSSISVNGFTSKRLSSGYVDSDDSNNSSSTDGDLVDSKTIFIQLSGEVVSGGVYELAEGSRLYEAVELAGGTTTEAALYMVNQAKILEDGEHIHFPKISEAKELASSLININTASVKTLTELSGIGEAKANNIVNYRETNGLFNNIDELLLVDGIKEGLYSQIKDYVTIY